jgi:V8-like Glu-specific endopeptidase
VPLEDEDSLHPTRPQLSPFFDGTRFLEEASIQQGREIKKRTFVEDIVSDSLKYDFYPSGLYEKDRDTKIGMQLNEVEHEIVGREPRLSKKPQPGVFYKIEKGDNLLKVASVAYQVGPGQRRLAFAQYINGHPLNHRYHVKSSRAFTKKYFAAGIISFLPKFDCSASRLMSVETKAPTGNCYAVIWIPKKRDNYHPFLGKARARTLIKNELEYEHTSVQETLRILLKRNEVKDIPHRWICALELIYKDPDNMNREMVFLGSGVLIGSNHILTAAHNLFSVIEGSEGTPKPLQVSSIRVAPGVSGWRSSDFLFGAHDIKDARAHVAVPPEWIFRNKHFQTLPIPVFRKKHFNVATDMDTNRFDYGLIRLDEKIGDFTYRKIRNERLSFWGEGESTRIRAINPNKKLKGKVVISGYDVIRDASPFKDGFQQFMSRTQVDNIDQAKRSLIEYSEQNTKVGMSGGPVWIVTNKNRQPILRLLGIHGHKGFGVLITREVIRDIERFKIRLG